jgi:spore maturation protein CgeB
MFFIAGYDYLFFSDKYIVNKLKSELDLNTHYLPQCFSTFKHQKVTLTDADAATYNCDITNAGNLYPSRAALYKHLTKYNFKMWGYPPAIWLKVPELDQIIMDKSVFNEEKSKVFLAAKIVLNNLHPAVIDGVNKRTFEIPACGGFQITSYRDATNELFEVGKEIVCYENLNDLKEKIEYYLNPTNERERLAIAEAGYKRAQKEHSYQHRIKQMLNTI